MDAKRQRACLDLEHKINDSVTTPPAFKLKQRGGAMVLNHTFTDLSLSNPLLYPKAFSNNSHHHLK